VIDMQQRRIREEKPRPHRRRDRDIEPWDAEPVAPARSRKANSLLARLHEEAESIEHLLRA